VEESFPAGSFELFESGDPADLARAILRLYRDPAYRSGLAARVPDCYRWPCQRSRYVQAVKQLLRSQRRHDGSVAVSRHGERI
jgi:hypothetical protein